MEKYHSGITGRALVNFGGKIHVWLGFNDEENIGSLVLAETKESHNVGDNLPKGVAEYEPQVILRFDNIESINIVRDGLDLLERALKDGKLEEGQTYE